MRINNNIPALQTYTNLLRVGRNIDKAVGRLSSGYRINSVADDAAGMAVSKKLKTQIQGMEMAQRNTLDAVSLAQTADGAMNEIHSMLQRIRELAVNMSNDTYQGDPANPQIESDRQKAQEEVSQLLEEINSTSYKTEYNTIKMLAGHAESASDGDWAFEGLKFQTGANQGMSITFDIPNISEMMDKIAGGVDTVPPGGKYEDYFYTDGTPRYPGYFLAGEPGIPKTPGGPTDPWGKGGEQELYRVNVSSREASQATIDFCDQAVAAVSTVRAEIGAYVNRLQMTERNLASTKENTEAALSRIIDTDMALEMTNNAQNSIISQAGISILGQANQRPQQVIQLLQ